MNLTHGDSAIMDAICSIGRANTSMKEIASELGISYGYMMRRRLEIARNNGYRTFMGFAIAYARDRAIEEMNGGTAPGKDPEGLA